MSRPKPRSLVHAAAALLLLTACGETRNSPPAAYDTTDPADEDGVEGADASSDGDGTLDDALSGDAGGDGAGDPEVANPEVGNPTGLPETSLEVRIATWNAGRFFDTTCDSGECYDEAFERQPSEEAFQQRAEASAEAIASLDADVVLLQEVESVEVLEAIQEHLDTPYPVAELGRKDVEQYDVTINVAVLARGELLKEIEHRDQEWLDVDGGEDQRFTHEFQEVHVRIEGWRVIVLNGHFKSKSNDDPELRLAEAERARELTVEAAQTRSDALVVLGGDLNDTPGSPPIEALSQGDALRRVAAELPESEQTTFRFEDQGEAIDHLFLATDARGTYVDGTVATHPGDEDFGLGPSDHAALSAAFELAAP